MGLLAFVISVVAAIMSFFQATKLPSFIIAIFGVIFAAVSGYQNSKKQEQAEKKGINKKDEQALGVGAAINSGAVCLSYLILLWFV